MAKLCQLIAVANGKKSRAQKHITAAHQLLQKEKLLNGISRTYRPKDDEGDRLPPERRDVQVRVVEVARDTCKAMNDMFNLVATVDRGNTLAASDIVVDGDVIVSHVPVTHLLFLEKQLVDLHTFVSKLPTLDAGERWSYSQTASAFATEPSENTRTQKVLKNHVKAEATKEHPAQVEVFTEDVVVGYWSTSKFSGAIPEETRRDMLSRVEKLQDAVKHAREKANSTEVEDYADSGILDYIFKPF